MDARSEYVAAQRAVLERHHSRAASRTLELRRLGLRAHALVEGDGPPLVLVHGGGGNAANWAPLLPILARSRTVIALDRPGCGLSDGFDYRGVDLLEHGATFLDDALDALGLPRASLVGNSMGGLFAAAFARARPERVERLALVGVPAGAQRGVPLPLRLLATPVLGRLLFATAMKPSARSMRTALRRMLVARPERVTREMVEAMWRGQAQPHARVAWRTLLADANPPSGFRERFLVGPVLRDVAAPTLFVWGEEDPYASVEVGRALAESMRDATFFTLPRAGHLAWVDDASGVADALEAWLSKK